MLGKFDAIYVCHIVYNINRKCCKQLKYIKVINDLDKLLSREYMLTGISMHGFPMDILVRFLQKSPSVKE